MSDETRRALIKADYNQLLKARNLPKQLIPAMLEEPYSGGLREPAAVDPRPCCYVHVHVDSHGTPPTPEEYEQVLDFIQPYVEGILSLYGPAKTGTPAVPGMLRACPETKADANAAATVCTIM